MTNDSNRSEDYKSIPSEAQVELLKALLEADDAAYPWNTADPDSEVYFASQEQDFLLQDWSEEEIATRSQTFFTQLEQIWCATTPTADNEAVASSNHIQAALQERFAAYIPQSWLDQIAAQVHLVFSNQRSMAEQLVQCVQALLTNWSEEDLVVLARPFAYAMRGTQTEAIECVLGNVRNRDWTALSEIEQARASLAIAQYAITQLQQQEAGKQQRGESPYL